MLPGAPHQVYTALGPTRSSVTRQNEWLLRTRKTLTQAGCSHDRNAPAAQPAQAALTDPQHGPYPPSPALHDLLTLRPAPDTLLSAETLCPSQLTGGALKGISQGALLSLFSPIHALWPLSLHGLLHTL